jgi:hypothetical protein
MRKANLILQWRVDHANIGDCACCVIRWVIDSESKSRKCDLDVHHPAYILVGERAVDLWDFPARGQHRSARGTLAIVLSVRNPGSAHLRQATLCLKAVREYILSTKATRGARERAGGGGCRAAGIR